MSLERIPVDEVCSLLAKQTGGILPSELFDAEWYASEGYEFLGAVVPFDGAAWCFVLFKRGEPGHYCRTASRTGFESRSAAAIAMRTAQAEVSQIAEAPARPI